MFKPLGRILIFVSVLALGILSCYGTVAEENAAATAAVSTAQAVGTTVVDAVEAARQRIQDICSGSGSILPPAVPCRFSLNPQDAVEQSFRNRATMGPPLFEGLPEAMRTAISLFQQSQKLTPMFAGGWSSDEISEVGGDFTALGDAGYAEMASMADSAHASGLPTELEIGNTGTYNPCPTGTVCLKADPAGTGWVSDTYKTDIPIPQNTFTGWFSTDATQLAQHAELQGVVDEAYQVSPLPRIGTGENDSAGLTNIVSGGLYTVKSGGHYVLYLNPYFNQNDEVNNQQVAQAISDATQGQAVFDWGTYDAMKAKYGSLVKDQIDSAYISTPELLKEAIVIVLTKN